MLTAFAGTYAADAPLFPDSINQILGRIQPNMSESQVETLVKKYYPDAEATLGIWSGQAGYVDFKVTSRHTISISEYNNPTNFALRFVHADMIIYIYDLDTKTRVNLSLYKWDNSSASKTDKSTEQSGAGYPPQGVGSPDP